MVNLITIKKVFICISKYGYSKSYGLMAVYTYWELLCGFKQQNMGTQWELEGDVTNTDGDIIGKITGYVSNNAVATDWVGSSVSTN